MKKSEIYRLAQYAVLASSICNMDKTEILRELMKMEDVSKFTEKQEKQEEKTE